MLLTHDRSLSEPNVIASTREINPPARIFSVAVEDAGGVELAEIKSGGRIAIARCRITKPDRTPEAPRPVHAQRFQSHVWSGDVEALPYPFRLPPNVSTRFPIIGFAYHADEIIVENELGLIHRLGLDGTPIETIPRGIAPPERRPNRARACISPFQAGW